MSAELEIVSEDFSRPYRIPFLIGVYLATNAIPDSYLVVDGPDCTMRKAGWVHGLHDWFSSLLDVFGYHRIATSLVEENDVTKSKGERAMRLVHHMGQLPDAGIVFVSSMPHVHIIGTQYDTLLREEQKATRARLVEVSCRSLEGDWLTGYSDVLTALARQLDISGGALDPNKVAIIGNLMDRTEEDGAANVRELERLVRALGLTPQSTWLSNRPVAHLAAAKDAGTLVALPLGRMAARRLAERTGAKVVELELPFGLDRTQTFLRKLAAATGKEDAAETFIDAELRRLIPRLEWVVPHVFEGKRVLYDGTPDTFGGFLDIASDLGMKVELLISSASAAFASPALGRDIRRLPPVLFEPKWSEMSNAVARLVDGGLDLMVASGLVRPFAGGGVPVVEFGFPSMRQHALFERPHLGFQGWACFVDRLANRLNDFDGAPVSRAQPEVSRELARLHARVGT